jgi:hypothetical protein
MLGEPYVDIQRRDLQSPADDVESGGTNEGNS